MSIFFNIKSCFISMKLLRVSRRLCFFIFAFIVVIIHYLHVYTDPDFPSQNHQNPDSFTAIGNCLKYPHQWRKGKLEPHFGLILAGHENSPGKGMIFQWKITFFCFLLKVDNLGTSKIIRNRSSIFLH